MPVPNLKPVLYWIKERESIRLKREAGAPKPWTKDRILQDNKFCNVRREDDRVTRWIKQYIRKPFRSDPNLWFMLAIARQINWPDTLQDLIVYKAWPTNPRFEMRFVANVLSRRAARGEKVFTGAYLLGGGNNSGKPKIDYICYDVLGDLWRDRHIMDENLANNPSLEGTHQGLSEYFGWGPFLAYQVVVDMRFTRLLQNAPDVATYAAAGPGTRRGLNRLYGRDPRAALGQQQALDEMLELYPKICDALTPRIDLSDLPNILCETDKMLRVRRGEGKMRSRFKPNPAPLP